VRLKYLSSFLRRASMPWRPRRECLSCQHHGNSSRGPQHAVGPHITGLHALQRPCWRGYKFCAVAMAETAAVGASGAPSCGL